MKGQPSPGIASEPSPPANPKRLRSTAPDPAPMAAPSGPLEDFSVASSFLVAEILGQENGHIFIAEARVFENAQSIFNGLPRGIDAKSCCIFSRHRYSSLVG